MKIEEKDIADPNVDGALPRLASLGRHVWKRDHADGVG
jgi:hypothetical protein